MCRVFWVWIASPSFANGGNGFQKKQSFEEGEEDKNIVVKEDSDQREETPENEEKVGS